MPRANRHYVPGQPEALSAFKSSTVQSARLKIGFALGTPCFGNSRNVEMILRIWRAWAGDGGLRSLGGKKGETDVEDVGVHAGIAATCMGVGHVMKLVAEGQRPCWGEEKLHA